MAGATAVRIAEPASCAKGTPLPACVVVLTSRNERLELGEGNTHGSTNVYDANLAARRLVAWLEAERADFEISLVALAGTLGLGSGTGRNAPVVRTLTRLVDFRIATVGETYAMRRVFPPLQRARSPGCQITSPSRTPSIAAPR